MAIFAKGAWTPMIAPDDYNSFISLSNCLFSALSVRLGELCTVYFQAYLYETYLFPWTFFYDNYVVFSSTHRCENT